jgi:HSP20 family protein
MAEQTKLPMKREDTAPRRWDPFDMFETLQEEMDRFWRRPGPSWTGSFPSLFRRTAGRGMTWAPRMDVYEKDNSIVVKAELPGLKKEDVEVELDNGSLVIRGESKTESEVKEDAYYRMERTSGSFYRRIPLPVEVEPQQVEATMTDGVLEVRIPRPAESKPEARKIPVK